MMTYLHVELHQFLLLARFSRRSFCERRNLFNNIDPLSGTDQELLDSALEQNWPTNSNDVQLSC